MHHFFAEELQGQQGQLSAADSHHASRVLRLQAGAMISVADGQGAVYQAEIEALEPKALRFKRLDLLRRESLSPLQLAIAPTKSNDRFEFFLEKATELGIARISPIYCQHSERKQYKQERGARVILAAAKQSKKGRLPLLDPLQSFSQWLQWAASQNLPKHIAYLQEGSPNERLSTLLWDQPRLICIGPEGDFSAAEIKQAQEAGFTALSLGSETLRTETAGIACACAAAFGLSAMREKT